MAAVHYELQERGGRLTEILNDFNYRRLVDG